MSVLLLLLLVVFVVPAGVLAGCGSGTPSKEDVERTILSYLKNDVAALTENPGRNVQAVELVEIGEPFEQGRQTMWPVKVNILKSGNEQEQAEYVIFKDVFGELKVLRRTPAFPSAG
jgi:hypothetical protein